MNSTVEVAPRRPKTFRLPLDLIGRLEAASLTLEVPQTQIVEDALRRVLGAAEEGPAAGPVLGGAHPHGREGEGSSPDGTPTEEPSASPQLRESDTVGLATWLAGRLGMPQALCRSFVSSGRVAVAGRVCLEPVVRYADLLEGVTFDGDRV